MYKVPISMLKQCRDSIQYTSDLLDIGSKGGGFNQVEVNKLLKANTKLMKILKLNYGV